MSAKKVRKKKRVPILLYEYDLTTAEYIAQRANIKTLSGAVRFAIDYTGKHYNPTIKEAN